MAIFGSPGSSLLANFQTTGQAILITQCFFDPLFHYDDKLTLIPWLATSYDLSSDSRTFTFHLRKGVKWSDGQPFTAADVESAIYAIAHPKTVTNWISYVTEIDGAADMKSGKRNDIPGVKVVDENTINITTAQPSSSFLDLFGTKFMVTPKHVLDTIPMDQLNKSTFWNQPTVSTGAFRLVKYTTDQEVQLERNPNYWGDPAYLDKVFVKITNTDAGLAGLQTGEIDILPGQFDGDVPPSEVAGLQSNKAITVTSFPFNTMETLYPNLQTMFSDVRVRQAMMYAIDREGIVKTTLLGHGKVGYSAYPDFSPYYNPNLNKYPYNPDKAKQLLKDANWDSSKQREFYLPTGDAIRDQTGTIVQQQLAAVGVNAKLVRQDFAAFVDRLVKSHTFDLAEAGNAGFNNLDLSRRFACNMLNGGVNAGGYCNSKLDDLMAQARSKVKFADQKPIVDQIQQIMNDEVPTIMLNYRDSIGAVNTDKIGGAVPHYTGIQFDIAKWYSKA